MAIKVDINGESREVHSPGDTPLLWVLRDELNLTGTKFGCGVASCGACTVHIDGVAQRSCVFPISAVGNAKVTTIDAIGGDAIGGDAASGDAAQAVQQAWRELDVVQCGYCQSGQIMQATSLLLSNPKPSDTDIDQHMAGNACRCATYQRIRAAIHRAASIMEDAA